MVYTPLNGIQANNGMPAAIFYTCPRPNINVTCITCNRAMKGQFSDLGISPHLKSGS